MSFPNPCELASWTTSGISTLHKFRSAACHWRIPRQTASQNRRIDAARTHKSNPGTFRPAPPTARTENKLVGLMAQGSGDMVSEGIVIVLACGVAVLLTNTQTLDPGRNSIESQVNGALPTRP